MGNSLIHFLCSFIINGGCIVESIDYCKKFNYLQHNSDLLFSCEETGWCRLCRGTAAPALHNLHFEAETVNLFWLTTWIQIRKKEKSFSLLCVDQPPWKSLLPDARPRPIFIAINLKLDWLSDIKWPFNFVSMCERKGKSRGLHEVSLGLEPFNLFKWALKYFTEN